MSAKVWIGLCLACFTLAGCGEPENTVAVPKEEAGQVKTEATPKTTKQGKPALNNAASVE